VIDPILSLAHSVFSNRGVFAALLGSGLSSASGIPTGPVRARIRSRSNSALCGASHKADDAERVIMRSVVAGVLSQLGSDGGALRIIPGHGGG
jgi:hypothetical protein